MEIMLSSGKFHVKWSEGSADHQATFDTEAEAEAFLASLKKPIVEKTPIKKTLKKKK